jgi:hypothetical protein
MMHHDPMVRYYIFALLALIPIVRIFDRAGFRAYWATLLVVPQVGFILCAVALALKKWPQGERS